MQFLVALLALLYSQQQCSMSEAVNTAYAATLQPFHGWIVGSTFTLALNFVPSR
jgi:hypothetical protein